MSVLQRHQQAEWSDTGDPAAPVARSSVRTSSSALSPGQVIGGLAGLVTTGIGVIAVVRGGIDATLNDPLVGVAGLTLSAGVGIALVLLGLLLIAGAASAWDKALLGFGGGLLFLGGIFVMAASSDLLGRIGTTRSTGTFALIVGIVAMVSAMMPTFVRERSVAEHQP